MQEFVATKLVVETRGDLVYLGVQHPNSRRGNKTHHFFNGGLSPKSLDIIAGGYLLPFDPPTPSIALRISDSSSLLSFTSLAATFSSRYLMRFVPGMGIKSSL